jgi:DNA-binding beta-propeller fold protein YncE
MTASPAVAATELNPTAEEALPPDASDPAGAATGERKGRRRKIIILLLLLLAFAGLLLLAIWYLLFRQPLPLPTVPGQVVLPGYVTSIQGATRPMGVAVTPDGGTIYITETDGDRTARLFSASGQPQGLLQPPVSSGTDHVPVYVARDPVNGEVYVSDRPTGAIYIYDATGNYLRQYEPPAALKGWQPLGLAFDKAGNLYVSDVSTMPQVVIELDRSGNQVRTFGDTAQMSFPNGVAVDSASGDVYVADSNNGRLLVFGPDGTLLTQVGRGVSQGNLGLPRGVAIDDNHVYVADSTGQQVFVYAPFKAGQPRLEYLGSFGTQGVGDGQFEFPNGLSLDSRGRIYVVDTGSNRVQVWSY